MLPYGSHFFKHLQQPTLFGGMKGKQGNPGKYSAIAAHLLPQTRFFVSNPFTGVCSQMVGRRSVSPLMAALVGGLRGLRNTQEKRMGWWGDFCFQQSPTLRRRRLIRCTSTIRSRSDAKKCPSIRLYHSLSILANFTPNLSLGRGMGLAGYLLPDRRSQILLA
jgi:hypothetical protein